jgi:hypothetical protein
MSVPLGTTFEGSFHATLSPQNDLNIPIFSDILPYYCIPTCGVYHVDDYILTDPLCILNIPPRNILKKIHTEHSSIYTNGVLPSQLRYVIPESSQISFVIVIHSLPAFSNADVKEINVLYHLWTFNDNSAAVDHVTLSVGGYCPQGVIEHDNDICEELNGLSLNRLENKIQYMHDGYSLSPNNAQLILMNDAAIHGFLSVAVQQSAGTILSYHIIPSKQVRNHHCLLFVYHSDVSLLSKLLFQLLSNKFYFSFGSYYLKLILMIL